MHKTIGKNNRHILLIASYSLSILAFAPPILSAAQVHWCYGEKLACGPDNWGALSSEFHLCKAGTQQSPIDIDDHNDEHDGNSLELNYASTPLKLKNNGHTLQLDYAPGSTATINGQTYRLLQLHFHAQSEHRHHGRAYDMELHLVHINDFGKLAVIGIFISEGDYNDAIQRLWDIMPTGIGENDAPGMSFNATALVPSEHTYYHYWGSLTTPPCSEGVSWNVFEQPIQVSAGQLEQFRAVAISNHAGDITFDNINRPIQARHGRVITEYSDSK